MMQRLTADSPQTRVSGLLRSGMHAGFWCSPRLSASNMQRGPSMRLQAPSLTRSPRHQAVSNVNVHRADACSRAQPSDCVSMQRIPSGQPGRSAPLFGAAQHVRGWGKRQMLQGSHGRRSGALAASDDDDSPALQVYSSTGAHCLLLQQDMQQ